jgi:Sec-independent protein secretion pathway component TatC
VPTVDQPFRPSRLAAAGATLFAAAVLAALLTPSPDAFSMLALWLPLWALLYGGYEAVRLLMGRPPGGGPGPGEVD